MKMNDRKFSRRNVLCGMSAGVALGLAARRLQAQTPIVMKLGTQTLNDAQHEWMKIFSRLVESGSNGRIKPELYPGSQLGTAPRMIEGTQFNSIQGFVAPPEFLSGVDSRFEVLGSPGLFKNVDTPTAPFRIPNSIKRSCRSAATRGSRASACSSMLQPSSTPAPR